MPKTIDFMQLIIQGKKISKNIVLCRDGKYRWICEINLYKNLSIFLMLWKIFFFTILLIFTFVVIFDIINWGYKSENLIENLKFFLYFIAGMTILVALGYLIYALIMGGTYKVLFEMDENGVNHIQLRNQANKAKTISALSVIAGLLSRNVTTVGVGLNSARTEMYSEFSRVKKIKAYPSSNLIKVNETLSHNQVYTATEDFNFVFNYIKSHCPTKKKRK